MPGYLDSLQETFGDESSPQNQQDVSYAPPDRLKMLRAKKTLGSLHKDESMELDGLEQREAIKQAIRNRRNQASSTNSQQGGA